MAVEPISEGVDGLVAAGGAGAPRPLPHDVARLLTHLAHLLDERIALRGVGLGIPEFAAAHLGVGPTDLTATTAELAGLEFQLAALALAGEFDAHPPAAVIGETQEDAPRFEVLELGAERRRVPYRLAAAFAPATLAPCPLVVAVEDHRWNEGSVLTVHSRTADGEEARRFLDGLLERSRAQNPFRGRVLEAICTRGMALGFRVVELPPVSRADVVLPAPVWGEVDRNVHGLFAALEQLAEAGLGQNRGVLLAGPPGTGKTLLCRVLASEVTAGTTVVFCDAKAVAHTVRSLYGQLAHLTPALVVMEDIDLVVGDRHRRGPSEALVDFLLALDGAISAHRGVVTVATTNDPGAIDAAAKRAARFDRVVAVPPPDAAGRAAILTRYLRALDAAVDVARVAAATEGATGADVRELVTLAVLHASRAVDRDPAGDAPGVSTELLLRLAADAGYHSPTGLYL